MAERDGFEEGRFLLAHGGELGEDAAAAVDLLAQEPEILGDRAVLRQDMVELLGHQRDGRERRAELVRRRRREAVELGQVLLPGEHQLGRGQRLGELARLLRHPPRVDAREDGAEQDRGPDPGHVEERQRRAVSPGNHGSGRCTSDEQRSREPTARRPSARVRSGGSAVAEIRTGARNRIENGFWQTRRSGRAGPPAAGCRRRAAGSPALSLRRWLAGKSDPQRPD